MPYKLLEMVLDFKSTLFNRKVKLKDEIWAVL